MSDGWKRGIYWDVRFFHGAIQLWNLINSCCWNTWKSATYSVLIEACVGTLSIKMTRTSDSSFLQWTELTTAGHHGHRLYLAHTRSPACQSNMQTVYMQLHMACTQQCNFSDKLDDVSLCAHGVEQANRFCHRLLHNSVPHITLIHRKGITLFGFCF